MPEPRYLRIEQLDAVRRITINRPEVRNAQSRLVLEELEAAGTDAVNDDATRVIILAGAGKDFSAGHDLGSDDELEDRRRNPRSKRAADEYLRLVRQNLDLCLTWRDLPKPTIAQVQGNCIMAGLMLASSCDLVVASEDARFADRTVSWGGAHVQYFSMPWDFGPRKAKEFLFTADFVSAAEAARLGLVNRVVTREELPEATLALATRIARHDPFALRMAKLSVNEMQDLQGQRQALQVAFKNYMMTIPHRKELGTFGEAVNETPARERIARTKRTG
jgi:enoyl-CoA hydratase